MQPKVGGHGRSPSGKNAGPELGEQSILCLAADPEGCRWVSLPDSISSPVGGTAPFLLSDHCEATCGPERSRGFSAVLPPPHCARPPLPCWLIQLWLDKEGWVGRPGPPVPSGRTPGRPFSCLSSPRSAEARRDTASVRGQGPHSA